ncbi:hypothetical protein LJ737_07510 [Hymenobacter sp. 15J16-1T3B]|uniref:hypothetical protein n=1 Tax=Hymenobacter sp. 15J16-1T3B TaxID=2886941 RepID=UPI001D0F8C9D|nr:hypothetical protein [Hymenobacter sp. 15J16-1T3B]MCC3157080.1 hypothetical protein [Hymenobacter sp. 15J16-1T3B]
MAAGIEKHFQPVPPLQYAPPTKRELAKMEHLDWVPASILNFSQEFNGFRVRWTTTAEQQARYTERAQRGLRQARGRIEFKRLQDMYGSWEGVVYFADQPLDNARLRAFKVVDMFSDEAAVGLFHDAQQEAQLYLCVFGEEEPAPLGVDFEGYLQLLTLTLGHVYWPYLLRDVHQHFTLQPAEPYTAPTNASAQQCAAELSALLPDFSLDAFVACYDQVRLRR